MLEILSGISGFLFIFGTVGSVCSGINY